MRSSREQGKVVGGVAISHPEKIIFEQPIIRKGEVAEYYDAISAYMLPELKNRLLTCVRCPNGPAGGCFFQKHPGKGDSLPSVKVREKEGGKPHLYSYVATKQDLLHAVQMNVLEFHTWGSRVPEFESPDRLIFDLDPDDAVSSSTVVTAAKSMRDLLKEFGLKSFVRVSGGKGLHVVVPILPEYDWETTYSWSRAFAELFGAERKGFVTEASKAKRKGKIFIDYLRNSRGATAVTNFSLRARPGAPAAFPLDWSDLSPKLRFDGFTIARVLALTAKRWKDPWAGIDAVKQRLPEVGTVH